MTQKKRLQEVRIDFKDPKTPYSQQFQDIYFAMATGMEESTYVYLEGSGFYSALREGVPCLRVGEIGFGVGLNFLLTLKAFIETAGPEQKLQYLSFEKHPVAKADLERLYAEYPELSATAHLLLQQYPVLTPGIHLLSFLDGRIKLHLALGDANDLLPRTDFKADHWYWDGFAPSRNPDAFSESLFLEIAKHTHEGGQGASFTSAGWVRRALLESGFQIQKRKGHGHKRECISARFQGPESTPATPPWFSRKNLRVLKKTDLPVAVIGAGLAGSAIARALAERGHPVRVYDPNGIANRASGNSVGLFNTQISKLPNPISRFSQAALCHFLQEIKHLHIPVKKGIQRTDESDPESLLNSEYPESFFQNNERGIFFPECGILNPQELCKLRLKHHLISVTQEGISRIERKTEGFKLLLSKGTVTEPHSHVVYALGADPRLNSANPFYHDLLDLLPTRAIRGQTILVRPTAQSQALGHALVQEGYASPLTPEITGHPYHLLGATYQAKTIHENQEVLDRKHLLEEAGKWPEFRSLQDADVVSSKVGFRLSTPDKLPLIGPLCDPNLLNQAYAGAFRGSKADNLAHLPVKQGEWIFTGFGSRGITYSSLGAELLSCLMTGDPLPLELDLWEHLHSARFFIRNLKRAKVNSSA